jgi:hypothetical protein
MNAVQQPEGNFYDNDRSNATRSLSWYATPGLTYSSTIPVRSISER